MLSFADFYFLVENQTVSQKLKSISKEKVKQEKVFAEKEINRVFYFQISADKKQDLINWYTLQLLSDAGGPNSRIQNGRDLYYCKDYIGYEINNINFRDASLNFQQLRQASDVWHNNLANNRNVGKPGRLGTVIMEFPDHWRWVCLNCESCDVEAGSMGHCGNAGYKQGDVIYSLRDPKNIPYLTFIINNYVLGESKGRFNNKPDKKFHPYIVALLLSDHIRVIGGGGYASEKNFQLDDLSENDKNKVLRVKPKINSAIEMYINYSRNDLHDMSLEEAVKIVKEYVESSPIVSKDIVNYNDDYQKNVRSSYRKERNDAYYDDYELKNKKINYSAKFSNKNNDSSLGFSDEKKELIKYAINVAKNSQVGRAWLSLCLDNKISDIRLSLLNTELTNDLLHAQKSKNGFAFLRYTQIDHPKIFEKIYNPLPKNIKSKTIVYFVATNIEFSEEKWYDLSDDDLDYICDGLRQAELPIPDKLQKVIDIRKAKDDFSIRSHNDFIHKILGNILNNEPTSIKDKRTFNGLSLLSYEKMVKLMRLQYFKDIVRDYGDDYSNYGFHGLLSIITLFNGVYDKNDMIRVLYEMMISGENFSNEFYEHVRKLINPYIVNRHVAYGGYYDYDYSAKLAQKIIAIINQKTTQY